MLIYQNSRLWETNKNALKYELRRANETVWTLLQETYRNRTIISSIFYNESERHYIYYVQFRVIIN